MARKLGPEPPPSWPLDEVPFEVIDGKVVEQQPMGAKEVRLSNQLAAFILGQMPKPRPGEVFIQMLFSLTPTKGTCDRRPDLAYVPYDRWPSRQIPDDAWPMVPALAAEFVTRSNTAFDIRRKVEDYFTAGVTLVWVVYPEQRLIDVFASVKAVQSLDEKDVLTGGEALPWFSLPLKELFAYYPKPESGGN